MTDEGTVGAGHLLFLLGTLFLDNSLRFAANAHKPYLPPTKIRIPPAVNIRKEK
jgi:hypothetical protein